MIFFRLNKFFSVIQKGKKLTYYQIMELNPNVSQKKIKSQFYKLSKMYHPDVYRGSDKDKYKQIMKAYLTLKDTEKREKYDRENLKDIPESKSQQKSPENDGPSESHSKWSSMSDKSNKEFDQQRIEAEIQKLKKKEITTNFEEINVREGYIERQMADEEKKRIKFVESFNSDEDSTRLATPKMTFEESLSEKIEMTNNFFAQNTSSGEEENTKSRVQKLILKLAKLKSFPVFVAFFMLFVMNYLIKIRKAKIIEMNEKIVEELTKFEKIIKNDFRGRMIY